MKEFAYKVRDALGRQIRGMIEADNVDEAIENLKKKDYLLISIKELKPTLSFLKKFGNRVSYSDISVFSRQLACLLKAGIPFLSSLATLKEEAKNKELIRIINSLMDDVEKGSFFSAALSKYENVFGSFYVDMIKTAEASGTLDETLQRLAVLREREEQIVSDIKSAATYPVIAVAVLAIGSFVVTAFVIPKFMNIFSRFDTELPLPTRFLIFMNRAICEFWYISIIGIAGLIIGFKFFVNKPKGRMLWDIFKLKVPIIGPLTLKIALSKFTRSISVLIKTGVSIIKALELAKRNMANVRLKREIEIISEKIIQGESLANSMKEVKIFPPMVVQMVAAGEGTGKLDDLLLFVSDYYDSQVKYALKNLVTYIEPVLILILGIGVLIMALGVFLPMWNMMQLFKH
ncbi:MAG: type II secretion system F family protein [Candidatus Omnitrophota bacterium]